MVESKPRGVNLEKSITVSVPIEVLSLKIFIQPGRASLEIKAAIIELAKEVTKLDELIDNWGGGLTKPWWAIEELIAEGVVQIEEGEISVSEHFQKLLTRDEIIQTLKQITGWWAKRRVVLDSYQGKIHSFGAIGILGDKPTGLFEEKEVVTDNHLVDSIQTERLVHLLDNSNQTHRVSSFDEEPEVSEFELISRESKWSIHTFDPVTTSDGWTLFRPQDVTSLSDVCIQTYTTELLGRPPIEERHELEHAPEALASKAVEIYRRHLWHLRKQRELATDDRLWALLQDAVHKCEQLMSALEREEGGQRANECRTLYGTGWEQEQAVHHIVRRAKSRCLILSSFLNNDFADYVSESFSESWSEKVDLRFWYGHSNDESQSEASETCEKYCDSLKGHIARTWKVAPTNCRTHAKVALNDRGDIWIGSWNALSAAPDSDVAESGVYLNGMNIARDVLDVIRKWAPTTETDGGDFLNSINQELQNEEKIAIKSKVIEQVNNSIGWLKKFRASKGKPWVPELEEHLGLIERFLSDLAERPCYSIIRTKDHRRTLLDMISTADTNVIITSDRIKPAGFDTSLQQLLATQSAAMTRVTKFEIRIAWGREDPLSHRENDDIKEAKKLIGHFISMINQVRNAQKPSKRKSGTSGFSIDLMTSQSRPMLTHGKLVQVDDRTMMFTSDNLLVYGDKRIDGDSEELGIVIHHPRMALFLRGEMELMHHELRANWDHTRWRVALSQEVARSPNSTCTLGEAMSGLWVRVNAAEAARIEKEPSVLKDFRSHLFKQSKLPDAGALRLVNLATKNRMVVVKNKELRRLIKLARKDNAKSSDVDNLLLSSPKSSTVWIKE